MLFRSPAEQLPVEQKELTEQEIAEIIEKVLTKSVNKLLHDECKLAIMENLSVDWYRREVVLSKIKIALTEVLCKYNMIRADAKRIATSIVDNIVSEIYSIV